MSIAILGLGWLGIPLAEKLISENHTVKGSTTTTSKIKELENLGIEAHFVQLTPTNIEGNAVAFLENCLTLIIDIPPQIRKENSESFVSKMENFITHIEKSNVKKVIFISSTSVFSDTETLITDDSIPNPDSESGKQLWEVEQMLHKNPHFETTVVRFGGLIGKERHPIHYLAGKKNLENPDAPINLIHLEDCINIIFLVLELKKPPKSLNAVAPEHPTRKKYYTQKALELKLEVPDFQCNHSSNGKKIISTLLMEKYDYQFIKKL